MVPYVRGTPKAGGPPSSGNKAPIQSAAASEFRSGMEPNRYISGVTISAVVATAIGTAVVNSIVMSAASSTTSSIAGSGNAGMTNAFQMISQAQFVAILVRGVCVWLCVCVYVCVCVYS